MASSEQYEFGPFRLEADQHRLWREDAEVELPPKALDTLLLLVRRAGQLVGRDEFFAALWPNTVVTEASLGRHIWLVRRALGQSEGESDYIQTVPKKGYRFVMPVRRSGAAVSGPAAETASLITDPTTAVFAGEMSNKPASELPAPRFWRWRGVAPLAIAAVVVLVTMGWLPSFDKQATVPTSSGTPIKPRASVALFDVVSDDAEAVTSLSAALTDLLRFELSLDEKLRIVSGPALAKLVTVAAGRKPDRALLHRLHRQLGIALAIVGHYRSEPDAPLQLQLQVLDTATGRILQTITVKGDRNNASELVVGAGNQLRDRLNLGRMSSALQATRQATLPRDSQTLQSYAEGMFAGRQGDNNAARAHLTAAAKREPGFLPAQLALTYVLSNQGYDAQASAVARASLSRASGAPRELRLALEAMMHEADGDWPRAIGVYRDLYRFYPEEIVYGFSLVQVLRSDGKISESLAVVDELRRRSANPSIDALASSIALIKGDGAAALVSAERALKGARELQAPLLEADALARRGIARRFNGDLPGALSDNEQARKIFRQHSDAVGEAKVTISIGIGRAQQGDFESAKAMLQQALVLSERTGFKTAIASIQHNLASIELLQGKNESARRRMEVVLQLGRELGNLELQSGSLTVLAATQFAAGETTTAVATYYEALKIARRGGMESREASILDTLAYVLSLRGQNAAAQELGNQALALARKLKNPDAEARALTRMGEMHFDSGDYVAARQSLQAALPLFRQGNRVQDIAEIELTLAALAQEEHKPKEALVLLDRCMPVLESNESLDNVAFGEAIRAEALLALHQPALTRRSLDKALAYQPEDRLALVPIYMAEARILAAQGKREQALHRLRSAIQLVEKRELDGVIDQIKRVQGRIETNFAQTD